METLRFNPSGVWGHGGRVFSQAVAPGEGQLIFMTGQVAWDANNNVVGEGNTATQLDQCFRNTECILGQIGGNLRDLVSITLYFTDRADIPAIQKTRAEWLNLESAPTSNFIQIPGLILPEFTIELVPIALIPADRYRSDVPKAH